MFSLILAHTNDYIPKEKFVAAGAGLQLLMGLGAVGGPITCVILPCLLLIFYKLSAPDIISISSLVIAACLLLL